MDMQRRDDLQDKAVQQLQLAINEKLSEFLADEDINTSLIYNNLVKYGFVSITPPLEEPVIMHCLTFDSLKNYRDGNSIKPGNILLNIKNLIEAIPEMTSIGAGMVCENPLIIVCGAFSLWLKLRDIATLKISQEQAFVIIALWKNCDMSHKISLNNGFDATNNLLKQYGESDITYLKYNYIIDSLVKMKCIEITEGTIWLREWISQEYIYNI